MESWVVLRRKGEREEIKRENDKSCITCGYEFPARNDNY